MLQIGWRDIVKEYFPAIVFTIPHAAMAMAVHMLGDNMALHAWQTLLLAVVLTPPIFGATLFAMWKLGLADDLLWL
jgi:hypothetical protein